jgi:hypothetical protein
MEKNQFEINVSPDPNGRIFIYQGDAPKVREKGRLNINGLISAPASYARIRNGVTINQHNSHVLVDGEAGRITLIIDEASELYDKVVGSLKVNPLFAELGINSLNTSYTVSQLARALTMKLAHFKSPNQHASLLTALNNVSINMETKYEAKNDRQGTVGKSIIKEITTKHDFSFVLETPLFVGMTKASIMVYVEYEPLDGGGLSAYLVAPSLELLIEQEKTAIIDAQLEQLASIGCPILFI